MTAIVPEPLLLPGQAASPPGPCDLTGMYVMHHAFRRDLSRFALATRRTPVADAATWRAIAVRWARFAHELHQHHSKEDEGIWPVLLERVDAADREVLEAMEAEHATIDPVLCRVEDGLRMLVKGPPAGIAEEVAAGLAEAVSDLGCRLDQHLAHEETDAIRIIQQHLSAAEWEHLEATVLRGSPSPRQLLFMLPWVSDELPLDARERLFAGAPAPVRWLLAAGRRSYDRLDRRAFRYA
jgi:iron-sulfur cluster repair protein YtfE (RIC family)